MSKIEKMHLYRTANYTILNYSTKYLYMELNVDILLIKLKAKNIIQIQVYLLMLLMHKTIKLLIGEYSVPKSELIF